jgi:hypothetical protein
MRFNNLPIMSKQKALLTPALQAKILYGSRPVCQKIWLAWFWSCTVANDSFWAFVMTLRSIACSSVSSLCHTEYPWLIFSHIEIKKTGIVLTSLDEVFTWCESALLLLIRESVWDELLRRFSLLMFNSSAIILRAHRRRRVAIPRIFAILSAFREVEGRPLLGSFWWSSRPSLNRFNRSNTLLRLQAFSP